MASAYTAPNNGEYIENIDDDKIIILSGYLGFDNEKDLISYLKHYFVE
ncbi:MAG: hypothetical protein ACE5SW_06350 [Nitrososphaeraceae archaeon]